MRSFISIAVSLLTVSLFSVALSKPHFHNHAGVNLEASAVAQDINTITQRRYSTIVGQAGGSSRISTWISTQQIDGSWMDVDYTTGCAARRANWPAQSHWSRIGKSISFFL